MKRYLGLDLGTKTLGVSITDRSNTIIFPHSTIHFEKEKYDEAIEKGIAIIAGVDTFEYRQNQK